MMTIGYLKLAAHAVALSGLIVPLFIIHTGLRPVLMITAFQAWLGLLKYELRASEL